MSISGSTPKASRWGSLLQQAVAGVESRLDTILAETDETTGKATVLPEKPSQQSKRRDTISRVPFLKTHDGKASLGRDPERLMVDMAVQVLLGAVRTAKLAIAFKNA